MAEKEPIFNLKDVIKLRKNDNKNKKRSEKIEHIVKFAFQNQFVGNEENKQDLISGKFTVHQLFNKPPIRQSFCKHVEAMLLESGLVHYVCILGRDLSFECKMSRHTLMVF